MDGFRLDRIDGASVAGSLMGGAALGWALVVFLELPSLRSVIGAAAAAAAGMLLLGGAMLTTILRQRPWMISAAFLPFCLTFIATIGGLGLAGRGMLAPSPGLSMAALALAAVGVPFGIYAHRDGVRRARAASEA